MAWTTEAIEAPPTGRQLAEPSEFDLPVKEFVGYDPKGKTSVTGSPLVQKTADVKQVDTTVDDTVAAESPKAEESVTLSPKVSALARKEQAQRQREQQLLRRERELEAKQIGRAHV